MYFRRKHWNEVLISIKQLSDVPFRVRLTVFSCLPFFPSNLWNKEIKMIHVKQEFSAWKVHCTLLTEFFARQNGYQNISGSDYGSNWSKWLEDLQRVLHISSIPMKSIVSYQVTKIFLPEAPERTTWTSPASRTWLTRSLVNIPFCFVCLFVFSVYSSWKGVFTAL